MCCYKACILVSVYVVQFFFFSRGPKLNHGWLLPKSEKHYQNMSAVWWQLGAVGTRELCFHSQYLFNFTFFARFCVFCSSVLLFPRIIRPMFLHLHQQQITGLHCWHCHSLSFYSSLTLLGLSGNLTVPDVYNNLNQKLFFLKFCVWNAHEKKNRNSTR